MQLISNCCLSMAFKLITVSSMGCNLKCIKKNVIVHLTPQPWTSIMRSIKMSQRCHIKMVKRSISMQNYGFHIMETKDSFFFCLLQLIKPSENTDPQNSNVFQSFKGNFLNPAFLQGILIFLCLISIFYYNLSFFFYIYILILP